MNLGDGPVRRSGLGATVVVAEDDSNPLRIRFAARYVSNGGNVGSPF